MTDYEKNIIILVHFLSFGSRSEMGLSIKEVLRYLEKPIPSKNGKTALECLRKDGLEFINELKTYMNDLEDL